MPNVVRTLLGENRPASGEGTPQHRSAGLPRRALVHRSPWLVRLQGLSSTTGGRGRGQGREGEREGGREGGRERVGIRTREGRRGEQE